MDEVVRVEDRKSVGRVVRCRQKIIAAVRLQYRRVAIAGEDFGRDIVGQERLPLRWSLRQFAAVDEEMRQARAEVAVKIAEELEIMLRLPPVEEIAL